MKLLPKANHNSFVGNSALIFLSRFFPTLASAGVAIYFSHRLDTSVYGTYVNFWTRLFLVSTFAGLGLQGFLITYTPSTIAGSLKTLRSKHYATLLAWLLATSAVFAFMENDVLGWLLSAMFLAVYVSSIIIDALLMAFRSLRVLIVLNLMYAVLFAYVHVLFVNGSLDFAQLFYSLLGVSLLKLIVSLFVFLKDMKQQVVDIDSMPPGAEIRSLWVHMGIYDVSQVVFKWIDKFIIGWLFTESVSAIYFNGSNDVPFLPLLMGAVGSAALMQLSADKSEEAPVVVMNKSGRILSSVVFPLFFFLVFFRYELFHIVFSKQYDQSVPIFLASIMVLPLRAYNFTVVLQNRHKGRIINIGAVIDLAIACILMYPLYLLMGLPGVAFSFVVSTYLQAGYYLYQTSRILNISWGKLLPMVNWAIKLIVFCFLFIVIHYFLAAHYTPQIVLICGMILAALISGISFLFELRATRAKYGAVRETQI